MTDTTARARIASWKHSLLEPSDPLLDLGSIACAIPLLAEPVRLAFSLAAGGGFTCEAGGEPAFERGILRAPLPAAELDRRLTELRRTARDGAAAAEHLVWLGLGLLTWCDATGVPHTAPVWLLPVDLERGETGTRLTAGGDRAPRLNVALLDRVRTEAELALELPDPRDLAALLDALAQAIDGRTGWRLDRAVRLGAFSFVALDLARDLAGLGDLAERAPIAWLAGASDPPALTAGAADLVAPLDADASQLAVVAAAGAGASFVVQGPPGSGKSQTIANVVAHCASAGKTVLVVSDRASALDVVQHRLAAIGLGDACLPLHGASGGRGRVLGALGRVLDRAFRPGAAAGNDGRRTELRAYLDAYVTALHAVGPFGMSIHTALGRLVELRTSPRAALAEPDAPGLDRHTFERRRAAVVGLAAAAAPVEPIATHPWRTSALPTWCSEGTERATRALDEAKSAIDSLNDVLAQVAAAVPGLIARTPDQLRALGTLADLAAASPRPGAELLAAARTNRSDEIGEQVALIRARGGGTIEPPRDPAMFLALALRHRVLVDELATKLAGDPASLDASELWTQLKRWHHGMAPLKFVALRGARAELRALARPGALETDEAMLAALEAVIAERACRTALLAAAEPARRWFGDLGRAADPLAFDLARIEAAVAWANELRHVFDQVAVAGGDPGRQTAWRALVAQVIASTDDRTELRVFVRLADAETRWECALTELAAATGIASKLLGASQGFGDHLLALRDQVEILRASVGELGPWTRFQLARRAALVEGVGAAVPAIERGDLAAADLADAWERATLLGWAASEQRALPPLARFEGGAHHSAVAAFAELDRGSLAAAKARALARLAERVPRARAADPQVVALRAELADGSRPVRAVLGELPGLLPKLTPCLLATPHAIAELLDPALPLFDVVVFDEASRLPIGHALGALARGKAVIVIGDSRQLPPAAGEGLLDCALAARLPELRLTAHYRSRHEDLFSFANRRYYDDRVVLAPAPARAAEHGIAWRRVEGGDRVEAEAIVAELTSRLKDPAQCTRSVAVVAMSRAQQLLIEDLLDAARAADSALDAALELQRSGGAEPLLVGTPDRVQGEERDIVLISLGHASAPDALEPLALRGLLAVATTRAREQMIVMSAYSADELPLEAPTAVRELLAFAATGGAARPADDAPAASPITAAIARALAERGWAVRHRVGCGAYMIDLAVVDPNDPDRYVLAIEHDGAAYASGASARDRDRLRAQRLAQLGWRVHRIWSLDWWTDAEREIHRAHGAIVAAVAATRQKKSSLAPKAQTTGRTRVARGSAPIQKPAEPAAALASGSGPNEAPLPLGEGTTKPLKLPRGAIAIGPYTAAAVPCGRRTPDDMFAARHVGELGKLVEQVLAAEAPIHVELLARRVSAYFGVGKLTPKITEQVREALAGRGRFGDEDGIVWRIDQDPGDVPPVRVAGTSAAARRAIDEVPLFELAAAARVVVERAHGLSSSELVRDCARLMGFARITDRVTERVALGVRLAEARGLIALDDGHARLVLG